MESVSTLSNADEANCKKEECCLRIGNVVLGVVENLPSKPALSFREPLPFCFKPHIAGNPQDGVLWTDKSDTELRLMLAEAGFEVGISIIKQLLR
jgi:hypothetical protein